MARSVAAEMHAGFQALRSACPMNLGKKFAPKDRGEAVARDVARFSEIVRQARERFGAGGPFLFGAFSAADAMYAPLVTRLDTYSIALDADDARLCGCDPRAAGLPGMALGGARRRTWIVDADEVDEDADRRSTARRLET